MTAVAAAAAILGLVLWIVALVLVRRLDAQLAVMVERCAAAPERVEYLRDRAEHAVEAEEQMAQELAAVFDAGTSSVRDVHHAIADIPFDILGALPGTREASERVRQVHDRTADGVYDALTAVNKAATTVYRSWVKRKR